MDPLASKRRRNSYPVTGSADATRATENTTQHFGQAASKNPVAAMSGTGVSANSATPAATSTRASASPLRPGTAPASSGVSASSAAAVTTSTPPAKNVFTSLDALSDKNKKLAGEVIDKLECFLKEPYVITVKEGDPITMKVSFSGAKAQENMDYLQMALLKLRENQPPYVNEIQKNHANGDKYIEFSLTENFHDVSKNDWKKITEEILKALNQPEIMVDDTTTTATARTNTTPYPLGAGSERDGTRPHSTTNDERTSSTVEELADEDGEGDNAEIPTSYPLGDGGDPRTHTSPHSTTNDERTSSTV